jgi:site-specific recombinase XerD
MTSLRRRMTEDMRVRNLSSHTQATYVQQVSLFARHFNKSPEILGPEEIRSYQVYLTNERKLAPSSIIIAVAALRFLYKITLRKDWCLEEVIPTPKKACLAFCCSRTARLVSEPRPQKLRPSQGCIPKETL